MNVIFEALGFGLERFAAQLFIQINLVAVDFTKIKVRALWGVMAVATALLASIGFSTYLQNQTTKLNFKEKGSCVRMVR